jgi:rhodanese-related sulfurtransferase
MFPSVRGRCATIFLKAKRALLSPAAVASRRHLAIAAHRVPGALHVGTRHVDFSQRIPPLLLANFFKYRPLARERLPDLRAQLLRELGRLGVLGRIYLATEGVNAAVSIPSAKLDEAQAVVSELLAGCVVSTFGRHEDTAANAPFWNLHVKVRNYLVRDGLPRGTVDVFEGSTGTEVEPEEWHRLVSAGHAVILDCRNKYESEVGRFSGAKRILSHSYDETWSLLPPLLPPPTSSSNILIYCTGGIRCVKASATSTGRNLECSFHNLTGWCLFDTAAALCSSTGASRIVRTLALPPTSCLQVLSLKGGINAYLHWLETTPSAPQVSTSTAARGAFVLHSKHALNTD